MSIQDAKSFLITYHTSRGHGGFTLDSVSGCMDEFLNQNRVSGNNDEVLQKIKEEFEEFKKNNDALAVKFDEAEKKISSLEKENKELHDEIKSLKSKKKSEPPKTE